MGVIELKYYDNEDVIKGYNSELYYRNDLEFDGADPTVIYINEGEHAGYYARISEYPRIDSYAADIPVLIEK